MVFLTDQCSSREPSSVPVAHELLSLCPKRSDNWQSSCYRSDVIIGKPGVLASRYLWSWSVAVYCSLSAYTFLLKVWEVYLTHISYESFIQRSVTSGTNPIDLLSSQQISTKKIKVIPFLNDVIQTQIPYSLDKICAAKYNSIWCQLYSYVTTETRRLTD